MVANWKNRNPTPAARLQRELLKKSREFSARIDGTAKSVQCDNCNRMVQEDQLKQMAGVKCICPYCGAIIPAGY